MLSTLSSLKQRLLRFLPFFMPALLALLPQTHHSAAQRHFCPGRQQELSRTHLMFEIQRFSGGLHLLQGDRMVARAPGVVR